MIFVVDFDGTIALTDTVDELLDKFADPVWRAIEEDWVAGRIGSRDCMKNQLRLVHADRKTLESFFDSIEIDPTFVDFVRSVERFASVAVVGDGIDYPIRQALARVDLQRLPVYSNRVIFTANGLDLMFPHMFGACAVGGGVCKCRVAQKLGHEYVVLIGDGRSDFCLARSADHVFAKGSLLSFCQRERIPSTPFTSFADVLAAVKSWDQTEMASNKMQHYVN
jgi:2-hydroxy-3-keto-5-methylthiopentenyl-1-phosphate phosphatase